MSTTPRRLCAELLQRKRFFTTRIQSIGTGKKKQTVMSRISSLSHPSRYSHSSKLY